jgi:hypothetical protein
VHVVFADPTFSFELLRTLSYAAYGGVISANASSRPLVFENGISRAGTRNGAKRPDECTHGLTTPYNIGSASAHERRIYELPTTIERRSSFYTVVQRIPGCYPPGETAEPPSVKQSH